MNSASGHGSDATHYSILQCDATVQASPGNGQEIWRYTEQSRARICKRLRSQGKDSEESIPPAYVACQGGTTNRIVVTARQAGNRFLGSLKGLQIRAQYQSLEIIQRTQAKNGV